MLDNLLGISLDDRLGNRAGKPIYDFLGDGVTIVVDGLPVSITASQGSYVDLIVRPYRGIVHLTLHATNSIHFVDLVGNKVGLETHQRGFGRLLVNVGILLMRRYYQDDSIEAHGLVTHVGSDEGSPTDIERRARFWMDAGFVLDNPKVSPTNMKARLGDLVVRERITSL